MYPHGVSPLVTPVLAAVLLGEPIRRSQAIGGLAIGYLAIVSSCLAYLWWNAGIRTIGAGRGSIFTFVVPIVATFSAIPILGECPGPVPLVGGALILGSLVLANRAKEFGVADLALTP